jgi:hypothetical protein
VVMVRVFSGSPSCPFARSAKGGGGAKSSRQFDTSIAAMRKGIELAALRRVEQPSVAGLAPAEARCSKVRAEHNVPHTQRAPHTQCAPHTQRAPHRPCCIRCPHAAHTELVPRSTPLCRVRGPTKLPVGSPASDLGAPWQMQAGE